MDNEKKMYAFEVIADFLNVRKGPSCSSNIVAVLKKGEIVTSFSKTLNNEWKKCFTKKKEAVFCMSKYLKEVDPS